MRECKRVINNKYEFRLMGELICSFKIGDELYVHVRDPKNHMLHDHVHGIVKDVEQTPTHTYLIISYNTLMGSILMFKIDIRYVIQIMRFDPIKGGFVNG